MPATLFAFTPRQVLLSNRTMKYSADNGTLTLERKQKLLLHHSIAHYLERSGFSKTLKKFCSEAQVEKDNLEGSSVDLEEMCLKYLEICGKDAKSNVNDEKEQGVKSNNKEEGKSKEKKRKSKIVSESLANNMEDNQLESATMITENKVKDDVSADANVVNGAETEKRSKDKKKKKGKPSSQGDAVKQIEDVSADVNVVNGAETEKRSKDKKKKKDKPSSQGDAVKQIKDPNETVSKKDNFKASNKEVTDEEKKDSKKRKRASSEENGQQVADRKVDDEPKRRKVENLNGSKGGEQPAETNANLESDLNSNKENVALRGQVGGDQLEKTSNKQTNGKTNGHLESAGEKSSVHKSQKKQQKGSVEQKPVKAFQRVQVDKVEFADDRLQDNSYWAKDGADSGYGAKAEEILGQVRGRDFRHEKTKKKRGTYRGGQIDLHSHSIKFNYSDDD